VNPRFFATTLLCFAISTAFFSVAGGKVLITVAELKLPDDTFVRRDAFPGPKIRLEMPPTNGGSISSPVNLKLKFEPRGAKIDPTSLTYNKLPHSALFERSE
jgi:hypothetical protein